jgi:branched-chain amino acid transport system substrate-binding protein
VKYAQEGGEAADGTIFPAGALLIADLLPDDHPRKSVLMEYKNAYESKFDEDVSTFGGHAYDALSIVVMALEEVGPDRAKIRDYIETINGENAFVGTAGTFNMTKDDHCGLDKTAFELLTVKDMKFVPYER